MLLHWRVLVSSRDEATPTPLPKWGVGGRALPFFGKRRASAIGRLWLWCLLRNGAAVHLRCCGVAATRCEAAEGGLGAPLLVESSHACARRFSPDTQNGPVHPSVRLRLASRARLRLSFWSPLTNTPPSFPLATLPPPLALFSLQGGVPRAVVPAGAERAGEDLWRHPRPVQRSAAPV